MEHHFDIEVAQKYGVVEAVIINNFQYWIIKNMANGQHLHDNRTWTYNSNKAMRDIFPYLTERGLRTALNHLIDRGVIITGNYNELPCDRTLWYAFVDEDKWICQKRQMDLTKTTNAFDENGKPIPYIINTDNKTTDNKPNISLKKNKRNDLDLSFISSDDELKVIKKWIAFKKERHNSYTQSGIEQCYKNLLELSGGDKEIAKQIVEQSIGQNWLGLFPLNKYTHANNKQQSSNEKSAARQCLEYVTKM